MPLPIPKLPLVTALAFLQGEVAESVVTTVQPSAGVHTAVIVDISPFTCEGIDRTRKQEEVKGMAIIILHK